MAAPEQKLHAAEARIEQAKLEGGSTPEQMVEWRQECLALAQLACVRDTGTPDKYQLGRACGNLAAAYLASGATEAALRHAERAEVLLLSEAGRTEAASLLPHVLHTLATSHADLGKYRRAAEYFNRALATSNEIYGKGHVHCCPVLRRAQSALGPWIMRPPKIPHAGSALPARPDRSAMALPARPDRSAIVPWMPVSGYSMACALAAAHSHRPADSDSTAFDRACRRPCMQVLRGWARMAVRRNQDHTVAVQLLRKEMDVREAHMGRNPSADERAELVSLLQVLHPVPCYTS